MLATFSFYILSAMPARSPGAIVGDFANPIERPFFLSLRPTPRRDVSIPFACLLSASFLRLRRFFSIDITPSRLPIARTEKFRTTQQSVRFFYWLLSCFRHSKRALPLRPFVFLLPFFLLISTRKTAKDNGTTSARILRSRVARREKNEGNHPRADLCTV